MCITEAGGKKKDCVTTFEFSLSESLNESQSGDRLTKAEEGASECRLGVGETLKGGGP